MRGSIDFHLRPPSAQRGHFAAAKATVELHNDLVRDFREAHRALQALPSPELHRFLRGLRAWMAGGFEWHATSPRYRSTTT